MFTNKALIGGLKPTHWNMSLRSRSNWNLEVGSVGLNWSTPRKTDFDFAVDVSIHWLDWFSVHGLGWYSM